jgi:BTB/POZ domain
LADNITSELLRSGLFHDFTIACDGKQFKCHKAILASSVTYFKCMLTSSMMEATNNFMDIKDSSADTVSTFLEFIYTDRLDKSSFTTDLLILSDRYQFEALKLECENSPSQTISLANAIKRFSTAHICSADLLLSNADQKQPVSCRFGRLERDGEDKSFSHGGTFQVFPRGKPNLVGFQDFLPCSQRLENQQTLSKFNLFKRKSLKKENLN